MGRPIVSIFVPFPLLTAFSCVPASSISPTIKIQEEKIMLSMLPIPIFYLFSATSGINGSLLCVPAAYYRGQIAVTGF